MHKFYTFVLRNLFRLSLLAGMLFVHFSVLSQNTIWYFGNRAGLEFGSNNQPKALLNSNMDTPEGCASITDAVSGITYYSNGEVLWMTNSNTVITGFAGDRHATQSALFLPKPLDQDTIYFFTLDADAGTDGLCYSVLVNGSVVNGMKNINLRQNVGERMCLAHHCNNEDAWLVVHGWNDNKFYAYRITGEGIDTIPVVSQVGSSHNGTILNATGYMKISQQGDKLALAKMGSGTVELFYFDNTTGVLSNAILLNNISAAYGVEFSPDGNVLYVSSASGSLYNYDLTKWNHSDIQQSKTLVTSSSKLLGALQLGPDDRIYLAQYNSFFLGRINAPNSLGTNCTYTPQAVYLEGNKCQSGLPPYVPKKQVYLPYVNTTCVGDTTYFGYFGDSLRVDSVCWNFGNPARPNDFATSNQTFYVYPGKGTYNCQLIIYHCDEADTLDFQSQVLDVPRLDLGNDTSLCQGESLQIQIKPENGVVYRWQDGSKGTKYTIDKSGTYWLQAYSVCGTETDTLVVENIWPLPEPVLPSDTAICRGDSIVLDAGDYSLSIWNNQDTARYFIARDSGDVYLLVTDSNACVGEAEFTLQVDDLPRLSLPNDTTICFGDMLRLYPGKADNYLWQDNTTGSYYIVGTEGGYEVEMSNHCGMVSGKVDVFIDDCDAKLLVPNAFTPNGDFINDIFKPVAQNILDFHMYIYDRMGRLVFESQDINRGWDGTDQGGYRKSDAYFYTITFHGNSGKLYTRRGFVNLIR